MSNRGGDVGRAVGHRRAPVPVEDLEERLDYVDWHRENDRRILFGANLGQRLQIAQLHGGWNA